MKMVILKVLIGFTIVWVSDAIYDLAPRERCVPTAVARGACHACVCSIDGVYYCRAHACQISNVTHIVKQGKRECEPHRFYRDGDTFCSCSSEGYWISNNCREKFGTLKSEFNLALQKITTNIKCTPKSLYLLDCNICECGKKGTIELSLCTDRKCQRGNKFDMCSYGDVLRTHNEICTCSDVNLYIDRLCLSVKDTAIQAISRNELEQIIYIEKTWMRTQNVYFGACVPGSVLIFNCNRCFCTAKKLWGCTMKGCMPPEFDATALRSHKQEQEFNALSPLKSLQGPCKPGNKYRYKCNTCVCSTMKLPVCTSMVCLEDLLLDKRAFEESYRQSYINSNIN